MGMLDGKYYVIYLNGGLEGATEDRGRLLEILREDYLKFEEDCDGEPSKKAPDEFDLKIKFDTYTLTWRGAELRAWYAINVQAL